MGVLASNGARPAIAFVVVLALAIGWFLLQRGEQPARIHYMRAFAAAEKKENDNAIAEYSNAIALDPRDADARYGRAVVWLERKEYAKATADFDSAIELDPHLQYAYYGRANARVYTNEFDRALADYNEAIRLDPTFSHAYDGRGGVWLQKGEFDKAIADFNEILRLDPQQATAYVSRGAANELKKEHKQALADYSAAIALDGKMADAYYNRARIWATSVDPSLRDAKKAVDSATTACVLSRWENPDYLDTLAAAYAATSDYASASKWQTNANALFSESQRKNDGATQLKIYQNRVTRTPNPSRGDTE